MLLYKGVLSEVTTHGWFVRFDSKRDHSGIERRTCFIPQIALLFLIIGWMEELGYMAGVVYMFDHILPQIQIKWKITSWIDQWRSMYNSCHLVNAKYQ
ncbi:MAG: hypothetical protein IPM92_16445 [Saprospiraceae bacterium]|nr:hypothetical protein [Saprospiraceae bacterium]